MASSVVTVKLQGEDLGHFDVEKITVLDSIAIKAKSGLTTKQFVQGMSEMDGIALQALVWLLRRRKGEHVELHTIDFEIGELALEDEPDPTTETSGSDAAASSVS